MPLDLSSFFLATLDFEDAHKIFRTSLSQNTDSNYPPYDIIRVEQNLYRITIALAGFTKDNVEVMIEENILNNQFIEKFGLDKSKIIELLFSGKKNNPRSQFLIWKIYQLSKWYHLCHNAY